MSLAMCQSSSESSRYINSSALRTILYVVLIGTVIILILQIRTETQSFPVAELGSEAKLSGRRLLLDGLCEYEISEYCRWGRLISKSAIFCCYPHKVVGSLAGEGITLLQVREIPQKSTCCLGKDSPILTGSQQRPLYASVLACAHTHTQTHCLGGKRILYSLSSRGKELLSRPVIWVLSRVAASNLPSAIEEAMLATASGL